MEITYKCKQMLIRLCFMTKPLVAIGDDGSGYHSEGVAFGAKYTDFYRGYI